METKLKLARQFAKTIKECDLYPAHSISNEETRAVLDVRSAAMEAIFQLGFDLSQNYKVITRRERC